MAGIYIHIPFCKSRCIYCDFFSSVSIKEKEKLVDGLCNELKLRENYLQGQKIETIYWGGGTPSLLSEKDFNQIFSQIFRITPIEQVKEITLEVNPDDINPAYLSLLKTFPFNRISIGVQSFQDNELLFLNRRHNARSAIEAIENCQKAGFENISIDLIYGLPEQTLEIWKKNLEQAIRLDIQHISSYHLIYEKGTKLNQLLKKRKIHPVDEELSLSMFSLMIDMLSGSDFIHYEISNFGKEGYFSIHNSSYWNGKHYLGIGPSAHSYNGISREWNVSSMKTYTDSINQGVIPSEQEIIDTQKAYNDYILTGLRTMWGIDLNKISSLFGENMKIYCFRLAQKHLKNGNLKQEKDMLILTRKGIFVSDTVMSDLIYL